MLLYHLSSFFPSFLFSFQFLWYKMHWKWMNINFDEDIPVHPINNFWTIQSSEMSGDIEWEWDVDPNCLNIFWTWQLLDFLWLWLCFVFLLVRLDQPDQIHLFVSSIWSFGGDFAVSVVVLTPTLQTSIVWCVSMDVMHLLVPLMLILVVLWSNSVI